MRLGVIDVGSNTVHLLVVDAHRGAQPLPAYSHKIELRLSEHTTADGEIKEAGVEQLSTFVAECLTIAEDQGIEDLLAFATSAIREAPNGETVLQQVREQTGADLEVLSGADEARLTFLAVRRWFGWSSGRLLCVDIGGGSLELAVGLDEEPDAALSLPLGAGRLTRDLTGDPPSPEDVRALRKRIRSDIGRVVRDLSRFGAPDRVVGTSKTVRSLARVTGAAPSGDGPYVSRTLKRSELQALVQRLAPMTADERAALPGVSASRAAQLLAGALVVEGAMDLLGVERLDVCPWALREGVILRRLDWLEP
ncbi:Ppx/GppA phosphatase family protein [Luteipulveratus mongoliensis]|uniref:Exopolyphosphatase n=1 Tax=Luteipulveratus mongoliensis TaxID=571913 RepID=A0A0K1JMR1_9MICO|nr:Ppx/GppA phosphatase family protein [Luteipulveratus mongoliensis]AKU18007.1 exopolyphosphatase [Luteipulveratus mongoliensis]